MMLEDIIPLQPQTLGSHAVDPISERLVLNFTNTQNLAYWFIDLDTTLGELQQTINSNGTSYYVMNHNFTELTTQNYNSEIRLVVFDDDVITEQNMLGAGSAVYLVDVDGGIRIGPTFFPSLHNSNNANKSIGYLIEFVNPVTVNSGEYPISMDINSFESDETPVNQITRTWTYPLEPEPTPEPIPPGPESPSGLTQQQLVAVIAVRNLALEQANIILDYWSDPTNRLADDRVLAQEWIDHANFHISLTTIQRDFHQTELDQLTG